MAASTPIDQTRFAELTGPLVGLTITSPWLGDYTALYLEVGPLTDPYPDSGRRKAQYTVYVGFDWDLELRDGQELSSSQPDAASRIISALTGQQVTGIAVTSSWELVLDLGEEQRLRGIPTEGEPPDWTLFLPSGSWVAVESHSLVLESRA